MLTQEEEIVVWLLGGLYALLMIIPIVQLIRIHVRSPELGWTIQKLFLAFTLVSALIRTVFFGVCVLFNVQNFFLTLGGDDPSFTILENIPRVVFYSTFTLLILFWAEIIHRVQNQTHALNYKRTVFVTLNVVVYLIQIAFWVVIFFFPDWAKMAYVPIIENFFFATLALMVAILFCWYGGRLFFMLRSFPIDSAGRHSKLQEVGSVSVISVLCFLVRCAMLIATAIDQSIDMNVFIILGYYLSVEILPAALVLLILHRLPPPTGSSTTGGSIGAHSGDVSSGTVTPPHLISEHDDTHSSVPTLYPLSQSDLPPVMSAETNTFWNPGAAGLRRKTIDD